VRAVVTRLVRLASAAALLGAGIAGPNLARAASPAAPAPSHPQYSQAPGIELFEVPGTGDFRGVACPYDGTCVVTGVATSGPNAPGVVVPIVDGKVGAVQQVAGTSEVYGVACMSDEDCLSVGYDGNKSALGQLVPITNGVPGSARPVSGAGALFGIDCVDQTCMLAGEDPNLQYGIAVAYNGSAPRVQQVGSRNMWQAHCLSIDDCLVVGEGGSPPNGAGILVPTHQGTAGAAQSTTAVGGLFDIGCVDALHCLGVGNSPAGVGQVVSYDDGGLGAVTAVPATQLHGITCQTTTTCIAVGRGAPNGIYVVIKDGIPGDVHTVPGSAQFEDVACATPDWCVAVGNVGGETGVIAEIELTGVDEPTGSTGAPSDPLEEFWSILPWLIAILGGLGLLIGLIYFGLRVRAGLPSQTDSGPSGSDGTPIDPSTLPPPPLPPPAEVPPLGPPPDDGTPIDPSTLPPPPLPPPAEVPPLGPPPATNGS